DKSRQAQSRLWGLGKRAAGLGDKQQLQNVTRAYIRVGDTITWKINSDELHSVSFGGEALIGEELVPIPGGGPTEVMLNPEIAFPTRLPGVPAETYNGTNPATSGIMKNVPLSPGAPLNDTFTLTFDTPGIYKYVCQVHPFDMRGTVIVEEPSATDLPDQAQIDAEAERETAPLLAEADRINEIGQAVRQEAGPDGTTIWHVQAGGISRDSRVELLEFLAKDITIQEGDTVVWTSPSFHNVTFHPGRMHPNFLELKPQDQGPPIVAVNAEVAFPAKPAAAFYGTGFWSSGLLGIGVGPPGLLPGGSTFSMTFNKAGTFKYMCAIHRPLGMIGSVTVTKRRVTALAPLDATANEFPEGLAVDRDGNIYVGMAPTGEVKRISPQGQVSTFAKLPKPGQGFMLGMEFAESGELYIAMATMEADTHGVWRVSRDGSKVDRFAAMDVTTFPNGVTFDSAGNLYVSDTVGGAVWKVDKQGAVSNWKADPILAGISPPVNPLGMPLGANGLAFDDGDKNLYVAVTEHGRIVRVPVNADGSAGEPEVFFEDLQKMGLPDGIVFDSAGNLYVAVVGNDRVVRISPSGEVTTLGEGSPLQNPSDLRFGKGEDADTLFVANFALFRMLGIVPGTPRPGVFKLPVTVP
ncbi:MAG: SMP-30/gluconolactonase/LRE family protein, partial [Chloroflexi bacterium]|nr:SMP-30/gluconolactonase/LRE family protein [Chloroflexota bacterium]